MQSADRNPEDVRKGATIQALRKAYGLTGAQLAVGISISRRYLTMIETGDRPADVRLCRRIADFLKVPLAAITVEDYDRIVEEARVLTDDDLPVRTKSGRELGAAELDELAAEAERGYDVENLRRAAGS